MNQTVGSWKMRERCECGAEFEVTQHSSYEDLAPGEARDQVLAWRARHRCGATVESFVPKQYPDYEIEAGDVEPSDFERVMKR